MIRFIVALLESDDQIIKTYDDSYNIFLHYNDENHLFLLSDDRVREAFTYSPWYNWYKRNDDEYNLMLMDFGGNQIALDASLREAKNDQPDD